MATSGSAGTTLASNASLLVIAAVFVGVLGGLHPSDRARDHALFAGAALFALLNLPAVVAIARRRVGAAGAVLGLLARVGFAVVALRFVHGISHESRHDVGRGCRARVRLGGEERCAFLHLCANEAHLSPPERALLLRRIRATPGCADP